MLWSKQYYGSTSRVAEPNTAPTPSTPDAGLRNHDWRHLVAADIISMPDKWEYPWFAAWDLAFHAIAAGRGRHRLRQTAAQLLLSATVPAPQRPAAGLRMEFRRRESAGARLGHAARLPDREGLDRRRRPRLSGELFQKLMRNFSWWVNRKDADGRNIFQGGFLGLDNIGVFDRSAPLPGGGRIDQADGTAWMALYCQNMLADRPRTGPGQPGLRGAGARRCWRHFSWIARGHEPRRPDGGQAVGRGGRLLLRCAAAAGRQLRSAQGALDRGTYAAARPRP